MHDLGRRVRAVLGAAVVIAVGGACAGDDDPSTLPDRTTAPTVEVTTSPTPEPSPSADPTATLEAEVEAFYRTYDAALNESWTSQEALDDRRSMFSDSCAVCLSGYEITKDAHEAQLEFDGAPSKILQVDITIFDADRASVLVLSNIPAGQLRDSQGDVVRTFPANPEVQISYEIHRVQEHGWLVVRSEVL